MLFECSFLVGFMQHLSPSGGGCVRGVGRLRTQYLLSVCVCRADNCFLYPVLLYLCTAGLCVAVFLFVGLWSLCKFTSCSLSVNASLRDACYSPSRASSM